MYIVLALLYIITGSWSEPRQVKAAVLSRAVDLEDEAFKLKATVAKVLYIREQKERESREPNESGAAALQRGDDAAQGHGSSEGS